MSDRNMVLKTECVADAAGDDGGESGEEEGTLEWNDLEVESGTKSKGH